MFRELSQYIRVMTHHWDPHPPASVPLREPHNGIFMHSAIQLTVARLQLKMPVDLGRVSDVSARKSIKLNPTPPHCDITASGGLPPPRTPQQIGQDYRAPRGGSAAPARGRREAPPPGRGVRL